MISGASLSISTFLFFTEQLGLFPRVFLAIRAKTRMMKRTEMTKVPRTPAVRRMKYSSLRSSILPLVC